MTNPLTDEEFIGPTGKRRYDIQDAYRLKAMMQEIAVINEKYEYIKRTLEDVPELLKEAVEFIQEMVEKKV